jgi:arabinose-5-phosphate isomerase
MSVKHFYNEHIQSILLSYEKLDNKKIEEFIDLISTCTGKIFFTGIGKNGHVASKITSTFSSIGVPCFFMDAVDSVHGDMGVINQNDILIAISKSGNTEELLNFLYYVNRKNCKIISIHSNPGNKANVFADLDIDLYVDKEADHLNIVPTSSIAIFTIFLQSVACEISNRKKLTKSEFVFNHPGGSIGKLK